MDARREIGKWLNEQPSREIDRQALAELCAEYDRIRHRYGVRWTAGLAGKR